MKQHTRVRTSLIAAIVCALSAHAAAAQTGDAGEGRQDPEAYISKSAARLSSYVMALHVNDLRAFFGDKESGLSGAMLKDAVKRKAIQDAIGRRIELIEARIKGICPASGEGGQTESESESAAAGEPQPATPCSFARALFRRMKGEKGDFQAEVDQYCNQAGGDSKAKINLWIALTREKDELEQINAEANTASLAADSVTDTSSRTQAVVIQDPEYEDTFR